MITKAQVKHIRSLQDKKYRNETNEFIIEGVKMIDELLGSEIEIIHIYATTSFINERLHLFQKRNVNYTEIESFELEKISLLTTPNQGLAIAKIPKFKNEMVTKVSLVLDSVQDPGNLGSIIRIADWFGIETIFMNEKCADAYNPKVIQASMGGVFRIILHRCDLIELFQLNPNIPIFVTSFNGEDVNKVEKITKGFIVIGNESNGVSEAVKKVATTFITIPKKGRAESLNAAVATGIVCNALLS